MFQHYVIASSVASQMFIYRKNVLKKFQNAVLVQTWSVFQNVENDKEFV